MNTQESRPPSGPQPSGPQPSGPVAAAEFFDRIRALGAVRPDEGRWAAGVCAGLARRANLDPMLVRGLFVVFGIVSGIGLGVYGLLWLVMPQPDGRIHAQQVLRGEVTTGFVGAVLAVVCDFPLSGGWFGWHSGPWGSPIGGLALVAMVGFGIWWVTTRDQRAPAGGGGTGPADPTDPDPRRQESPGTDATTAPSWPASPAYGTPGPAPTAGGPETEIPRPAPGAGYGPAGATPVVKTPPAPRVDLHRPLHSLTLATLGTAILAVGSILAWDRFVSDVPGPEGVVAVAVALGIVALGVLVAGALGRRAGGLAPIAVLLAIASAASASASRVTVSFDHEVRWTPTVATATTVHELGAGRAILDLTSSDLTAGATAASPITVRVQMGVGELIVIVPTTTPVQVHAELGAGNLRDDVDRPRGRDDGGVGIDRRIQHPNGAKPALVVRAEMGLGQIRIVPQGTDVTR